MQVFDPFVDNTLLIGAVGQLQFEVVHLAEFTTANSLKLAKDVDGNLVYLAGLERN